MGACCEEALRQHRGNSIVCAGVVIVSHDEELLESACDRIVEVRGRKLHHYVGKRRRWRTRSASGSAPVSAPCPVGEASFVTIHPVQATTASFWSRGPCEKRRSVQQLRRSRLRLRAWRPL